MHKIKILNLNKNNSFLFDNYKEFLSNFIYYKINKVEIDFVLDENIIEFDELCEFISVLFDEPFDNPDKCTSVDELISWLKAIQFISLLEDELLS